MFKACQGEQLLLKIKGINCDLGGRLVSLPKISCADTRGHTSVRTSPIWATGAEKARSLCIRDNPDLHKRRDGK